MNVPDIPKELLHLILEYDGRIKHRNGEYINTIHKKDTRYDMIIPIIKKKLRILNDIEIDGSKFYFEFAFDICNQVGLCYDYHFSYADTFEICYYDTRNGNWIQTRTYL